MNTALKIFFILILVALVSAAVGWALPVIQERYFRDQVMSPSETESAETSAVPSSDQSTPTSENSNLTEEPPAPEPIPFPAVPENETTQFKDVTAADCQTACVRFKEKSVLDYCRQYCGFAAPPKPDTDCSALSGLEKDYCLKNIAVEKKDFRFCDAIGDQNIRRSCQTRITEDWLDQR